MGRFPQDKIFPVSCQFIKKKNLGVASVEAATDRMSVAYNSRPALIGLNLHAVGQGFA